MLIIQYLVNSFIFQTEVLDSTNRDLYTDYLTSIYAQGERADNTFTTHLTCGIGHGIIVILALYLDRDPDKETAHPAAVYDVILQHIIIDIRTRSRPNADPSHGVNPSSAEAIPVIRYP